MSALRFSTGTTTLGSLLVATNERGVCAILLGDNHDAVVRDLQDRFPHAELIAGELGGLVSTVAAFIDDSRGPTPELTLAADGTAFQRQVWRALQDVPAGSTASYTDIANRIGAPHAIRAVAQACAANPLAVVIPCHRVIASDGSLSGYRWGIDRKRALLAREAHAGLLDPPQVVLPM